MTRATTKDSFGRAMRDLRISVTDRCNFRCAYCMPAEIHGDSYAFLPKREILTFEEIERVARVAISLGVRKLRITGGEPLLRADLPRLLARLARIDGVLDLSLTTNGFLLAGFAEALKQAGLERVTVSLDSLDEAVFKRMSGRRSGLAPVLAGIEAAERAGLGPIKLNCVVKRGTNDHTLLDLARRFRGTDYIVRFVEFMDVGNLNAWNLEEVVPASEIRARIEREFPLEPIAPDYPGEVATRFRYRDGAGEIGLVASVSRPFCGSCTRARLSPEGKLVTCLFANDGTDLRGPLRAGATDDELRALIEAVWHRRTDRYSEERAGDTQNQDRKIEMFRIGG
ncbi:MAG: GTP 3',8-cyclase MoaA [Planctomycetota bacterium]|jgi:cyclic pyranopterin phosphate synthase